MRNYPIPEDGPEITKEEFIRKYIDGDLEKWIGGSYPRSLMSFLYSVEEWACNEQRDLRRRMRAEEKVRSQAAPVDPELDALEREATRSRRGA